MVQTLPSSQVLALPLLQTPLLQSSPSVQASPSSQGAEEKSCTQPVFATQLPTVHGLPSSQLVGAPPPHAPFSQSEPEVQGSPSSQAPWMAVCTQTPCSQPSVVQELLSSQLATAHACSSARAC